MAPPPPEAELARSATTIDDSLPSHILTEVLLRVSTPAALVHAAAVSRSWRDAIADPDFLESYRKRHKSSPFLGLYVPRPFAGPPSLHMRDSIRMDHGGALGLKAAALRAFDFAEIRRYQDHRRQGHDAVDSAFIFGGLGVHPHCRLLDCHNSRLLLTRGDEALEVRSPLARESILLPFPPDVGHPGSLEACLLQPASSSFLVVCLQHRGKGRSRQVRAVDYDSTRKSWQDHSWYTVVKHIEGPPQEVVHAGHRVFCTYMGVSQAALVLDTRKMEFSVLTIPTHENFAIGELEDNVCCLVGSIGNICLRVWQLEEQKLEWKHHKDISLDQVLANRVGYHRPRAISNGIALVCSTTRNHHFVLDLNTNSLMDKFEFEGHSAYIMQMPWPPAFSHPTANTAGGSESDQDGEPASVGDARTVVADEIEGLLGGAPALVEEPDDPCQTRPEPSPSPPSLGCCFSTDSSQEVKMAPLLCSVPGTSCRSQDTPPATAPLMDLPTTSSPAEPPKYMEDRQRMALTTAGSPSCPQRGKKRAGSRESKGSPEAMGLRRQNCMPKLKWLEYLFALRRLHSSSIASKIPDLCDQFSDVMNSKAAGTGSGELDVIEGMSGGTLAMAPPVAPAVESEEPLLRVCRSWTPFRERSLNHDLLLQHLTLASCPQKGGQLDGSRCKGSPQAPDRGRRQNMPNPKYFGGDWCE